MNEKNLKRATEICSILEKYRYDINKIDNVSKIETKRIDISVRLKNKIESYNVSLELGDDYIKWSLSREKLRLKSRILELEAELKKL
ncbi:MAG: hypothetical protein ACOVNU_11640 [Candidatus Kapaibacteriota bacterium]